MKKIILFVQNKDAESALMKLRALEVVHVEHVQKPQGKDIVSTQEDVTLVSEALEVLYKSQPHQIPCMEIAQEPLDWKSTARHIVDLHKRVDQLEEYSKSMRQQISEWEAWGDFDPDKIRGLAESHLVIRLYKIPSRELSLIPQGVAVERLFSDKGMIYCAVISQHPIDIPFKAVELPKMGLERMKARVALDQRMIESLRGDIHKFICIREKLAHVKHHLQKDLEFQEILRGMGQESSIVFLRGFVPIDALETLMENARTEKWGIVTDEPSPDDEVPTLIRNARWISIIRPVFQLLEIVPGYEELDISLWFLIFFGMFFGILIGDAGYGLVYGAITFCVQQKMRRKMKDNTIFFLLYVLSAFAVVWGVATGTFFGQAWVAKLGIKPLIPLLNDTKFMQAFCFFVGALHLSIAHMWRALLKFPSFSAFADVGWICVLWSAFVFAKVLILGDALPAFTLRLLFLGMALVVVCTNPQKNFLKSIGHGLGTLALSLMNNFTDVVSYVRLFAVGMAGLAIAETCNTMAQSLGAGNIFLVLASVLVVVVGHVLNIVLGPMSVLVHGVRLNVLEFSGHANVTWSGKPYRPFRQ